MNPETRKVFYTGSPTDVKPQVRYKQDSSQKAELAGCFTSPRSNPLKSITSEKFQLPRFPHHHPQDQQEQNESLDLIFKSDVKTHVKKCNSGKEGGSKKYSETRSSFNTKSVSQAKPQDTGNLNDTGDKSDSPFKQSLFQRILRSPLLHRAQSKLKQTTSVVKKDEDDKSDLNAEPHSTLSKDLLPSRNISYDNSKGTDKFQNVSIKSPITSQRKVNKKETDNILSNLDNVHSSNHKPYNCDIVQSHTSCTHSFLDFKDQQSFDQGKQSLNSNKVFTDENESHLCERDIDVSQSDESFPFTRLKKSLIIKCSSKVVADSIFPTKPSEESLLCSSQCSNSIPKQSINCDNQTTGNSISDTLPQLPAEKATCNTETNNSALNICNDSNKQCDDLNTCNKLVDSNHSTTAHSSVPNISIDENCNPLAYDVKLGYPEIPTDDYCDRSCSAYEVLDLQYVPTETDLKLHLTKDCDQTESQNLLRKAAQNKHRLDDSNKAVRLECLDGNVISASPTVCINTDSYNENSKSTFSSFDHISVSELDNKSIACETVKNVKDSVDKISDVLKTLPETEAKCKQCLKRAKSCEKTLTSIEKPLKAIKVYLEKLFHKFHSLEKCSVNSLNESENHTLTGGTLDSNQSDHQLDGSLHLNDSFDHSEQTFEYQLENGVWADSRNSLKTLYDDEAEFCLDDDALIEKGVVMEQELTDSGQVLSERELQQRRIERKRKNESDTMTRRESVREWLESLDDGDGAHVDMDKSTADAEPSIKPEIQDHNANFEDDLFLGAEAKLIRSVRSTTENQDSIGDKENVSSVEKEEKRDKLSRLKRSQTLDPPSTPPVTGGLHQRRLSLHKRFQFYHQDSFQSNDSNKTYSSVNEILQERSGNPIEILTNLGFGSKAHSDRLATKIPTRFLTCPSKAEGIHVEEFLDQHPQIKENLQREETRGQPILIGESFMSSGIISPISPVASEQDIPDALPTTGPRRNSLFSAARNIILLNRFSSTLSPTQPENSQATLHQGITPQGKVFQSILHPDNTEFFANQGLYDDNSEEKKKKYKLGNLISSSEKEVNISTESNVFKKSRNFEGTLVDDTDENINSQETTIDNSFNSPLPRQSGSLFDKLLPKNNKVDSLFESTKDSNAATYPNNSSHIDKTDMLAYQDIAAAAPLQKRNSNDMNDFKFENDDQNINVMIESHNSTMEVNGDDVFSSYPNIALDPFSKQNSVINNTNYADNLCDNYSTDLYQNSGSNHNFTEFDTIDQSSFLNNDQNDYNDDISSWYSDQNVRVRDQISDDSGLSKSEPSRYSNLYKGRSKSSQELHLLQAVEIDLDGEQKPEKKPKKYQSNFEKYKKNIRSHSLFPEYTESQKTSQGTKQLEGPPSSKRDRLAGARKNWQSSSNFLQTVEFPAQDIHQSPFQAVDHPSEQFGGRLFNSQSMTSLNDLDRYSDAGSSDYGESTTSSFMERLRKLKDQHETNRDYQIENTLGQVEKVKMEISQDPNKIDDPKYVKKLQKKYSKGPSYLDKLKNLKAVHERKLHESLSNNPTPYYEDQPRQSVDDLRIGVRKPSLMDRLIEEGSINEHGESTADDVFMEYGNEFPKGNSLFSQLSKEEVECLEADQSSSEELVGLQDIVLLHGLTDDVLGIIQTHKESHTTTDGDHVVEDETSETSANEDEINSNNSKLVSAMVSLMSTKDSDLSPLLDGAKDDEVMSHKGLEHTDEQQTFNVQGYTIPEVRVTEEVVNADEKRVRLQAQGKTGESFEMEEIQSTDIEADSDTISSDLPTIKPPRGPLLRTGSAQSDSSGFADSTDSHSVGEAHWEGRKLKNSESGIETASNCTTDAALVTSSDTDSFSRQSSSTSSNTVIDINLPVESSPASDSPPTTTTKSQDSSQDNKVDDSRSHSDDAGRKVKMTSSRGHPHSKGTGDYSIDEPGFQIGDFDDLNNAVGELEIDLYTEECILSPTGTNSGEQQFYINGSNTGEKPNNWKSVEEVEINLYDTITVDNEIVCEETEPKPKMDFVATEHDSPREKTNDKELKKAEKKESLKKKIVTRFENIIQGVRKDSTSSVIEEQQQEKDLHDEKDNVSLSSGDNSLKYSGKDFRQDSVSSAVSPTDSVFTSEKDFSQNSKSSVDHGDSMTSSGIDIRQESLSSLSQDEVINHVEIDSDVDEQVIETESSSEQHASIPQTQPESKLDKNTDKNAESDSNVNEDSKFTGYKHYEFPKIRFGKNRHKKKSDKESKGSMKSESTSIPTVPGAPKTTQEISKQVALSYKQHFQVSDDDEQEISEYDLVLGPEPDMSEQDKPASNEQQVEVVDYNRIETDAIIGTSEDKSKEKTDKKHDVETVKTKTQEVAVKEKPKKGDNVSSKENSNKHVELVKVIDEKVVTVVEKSQESKKVVDKSQYSKQDGVSGVHPVSEVNENPVESYLILDDIEVADEKKSDNASHPKDSTKEKAEEKSKRKGWFPWGLEKDKGKETEQTKSMETEVISKEDVEDHMESVKDTTALENEPKSSMKKEKEHSENEPDKSKLKKTWFSNKTGSKDSPPKETKPKKIESLSDALKKNSDIVFKATLSPFRRVWSPEEHKAESVEEASLKKQMSVPAMEEEVDVSRANISYQATSPSEDLNANEKSLAEEFSDYSDECDKASVHEQDISPITIDKKLESGLHSKFVSFGTEKEYIPSDNDDYDHQSEGSDIDPETVPDLIVEKEETSTDDEQYNHKDETDNDENLFVVNEEVVSPIKSDRNLESKIKREESIDQLLIDIDNGGALCGPTEVKQVETYDENHELNTVSSPEEAVLSEHLEELKLDVVHEENKALNPADLKKELDSLRTLMNTDDIKSQPTSKFIEDEQISDQLSKESSVSVDEYEPDEQVILNLTELENVPQTRNKEIDPETEYLQNPANEQVQVDNYEQSIARTPVKEQISVEEPSFGSFHSVPDYNDNKIMHPTDLNDNDVLYEKDTEFDIPEEQVEYESRLHHTPNSDSILDKFFDNPNFQAPSDDESVCEEVSQSSHSMHFENPNFVTDDERGSSQGSLNGIDNILDFAADNVENKDLSQLNVQPVSHSSLLYENNAKDTELSDVDSSFHSTNGIVEDQTVFIEADNLENVPVTEEDQIIPQVKSDAERSINTSQLFKDNECSSFEDDFPVSKTSNPALLPEKQYDNKQQREDHVKSSKEFPSENGVPQLRHGSIESTRKPGSDTDDKCVGTDLDLSGYSDCRSSVDSPLYHRSMDSRSSLDSPVEFSQRMVVSKLSLDPKKTQVPMNDIAEVVLIIENGEIKEVQRVENETLSPSVSGKYESYELVSDKPFAPFVGLNYKEHGYSDTGSPKDYTAFQNLYQPIEHRRSRMTQDSGYNSNFTSISENHYPDRQHLIGPHSSSLNLKVSPNQQGASYIPVIRDSAVRSKEYEHFGHHLLHGDESVHDSSWSVASGSSDVSEHQVLCTMLKQSEYYGPQIEGILQKSQWPLFARTRASTKQNLVEEVKLMQHALQKYKMEFKTLEIRSRNVYKENLQHLTGEERDALGNLEDIRDEILNEIVDLEKALAVRMKNIIAGTDLLSEQGPLDLASLHVISNMIEMLKEQVYHSNIVNSMCDPENSPSHPLLQQLEDTSQDHSETITGMKRSNSLLDHLTLLQSQMQAQQSQQTAVLNTSLRELKTVLLDEIRNSIHSETQELKYKLENTETQLHELKEQISRSGTPHNMSHELLLVDIDVNQTQQDGDDETF